MYSTKLFEAMQVCFLPFQSVNSTDETDNFSPLESGLLLCSPNGSHSDTHGMHTDPKIVVHYLYSLIQLCPDHSETFPLFLAILSLQQSSDIISKQEIHSQYPTLPLALSPTEYQPTSVCSLPPKDLMTPFRGRVVLVD